MKKYVLFLVMVGLWAVTSGSTTVSANGYCGDGICQDQACQWGGGSEACEEYSSCPQDCQGSGPGGYCGDGICDAFEYSVPFYCTQDCTYGSGGGGGNCPDVCSGDIQCTSCPDKPYCTSGSCSGF